MPRSFSEQHRRSATRRAPRNPHLDSRMDIAELRLDHLDRNVDELKASVAVLRNDVSELKTDVSILKADVSGIRAEMKQNYATKADLLSLKHSLVIWLVSTMLAGQAIQPVIKQLAG